MNVKEIYREKTVCVFAFFSFVVSIRWQSLLHPSCSKGSVCSRVCMIVLLGECFGEVFDSLPLFRDGTNAPVHPDECLRVAVSVPTHSPLHCMAHIFVCTLTVSAPNRRR